MVVIIWEYNVFQRKRASTKIENSFPPVEFTYIEIQKTSDKHSEISVRIKRMDKKIFNISKLQIDTL